MLRECYSINSCRTRSPIVTPNETNHEHARQQLHRRRCDGDRDSRGDGHFCPMNATQSLVILLCYAIGCFVTAWYLVRWRTGADLRTLHSGNTGARNAGRVLGRGAFVGTAVLDGLRGMLAMWLAAKFGLRDWSLALAGAAVLAGHLWPVQLGFRGGKGVAVGTGIILWMLPLGSPPEWTLTAGIVAIVLWCHRDDLRRRFGTKPPP